MLLVCVGPMLGVVPVKFAIRMGLVEGQANPSNNDILHTSRLMLLVWYTHGIRGIARSVGP